MKQKEILLQNGPRFKISVKDIPRRQSFYSAIPRGSLTMISILLFILPFVGFIIFSCNKEPDLGGTGGIGSHPIDNDRTIPYNHSEWMLNISDNKYLSEITIPGTHDCGADLHTSAQGGAEAQTIAQDFRLSNQLKMGVRWFDVRVNLDDTELKINHGIYYLHKHLGNLLDQAIDFISNHPSEVVVFMIKQEHSSKSDEEFGQYVYNDLVSKGIHHFWLQNRVPLLGEVRGKIVIVRKFENHTGKAFGMHFEWDDNAKGSYSVTEGVHIYVQDHYSLVSVSYETKNDEIIDCIVTANHSGDRQRFYINFTSGERNVRDLRDVYCNIAPVINQYFETHPGLKQCGVIMLNFAGGTDNGKISSDLLETVINQNSTDSSQVTIGTQTWKTENLYLYHYKNGDEIQKVTSAPQWCTLTTGAFCDYNDDSDNSHKFGKLYNWYAVTDPRGLAPDGWRIPTIADYTTLINYLGGETVAGGKMKDTCNTYWSTPNTGASNSSRFCGRGGGYRISTDGSYSLIYAHGYYWTSSEENVDDACFMHLYYNSNHCDISHKHKRDGFSVRLIKE